MARGAARSGDRTRIGQGAVQHRGLFKTILERLPEGPAFYPKDTLTDKTLRFFASEIIREKILRYYDKEIPYCCEIEIESYREEPAIDRIAATIYVARESQKGIVIGHKGEKLKKVGQAAREDMEQFFGKKIFLQLFVKVSEDWRNNDRQLRRFRIRTRIIKTVGENVCTQAWAEQAKHSSGSFWQSR